MSKPNPRIDDMNNPSKSLETALKFIMSEKNLPSEYPDFESFTREVVRQISPYVVLVDRKAYTELSKPDTTEIKSLTEAVARHKKHNDEVEDSMRKRGSIPPPPMFPRNT